MKKNILVLGAAILVACSPQPSFDAAQFNGRWNLTVENDPRGRAWWLEVENAGTAAMKGKFVGAPGGQVDEIPAMRMDGRALVWEFERPSRPGADAGMRTLVYAAKIVNEQLTGGLTIDGDPEASRNFTGRRAPLIAETDDGTWAGDTPVELFNGKDLGGWSVKAPGRPMEWYVENGLLKNGDRAADIVSDAKFWNFKLHIEFKVADKSNSGIGLRGRYEVQIYGDHGRPPSDHGNGALYSRIAPAVNATRPPADWQVFDITLIGRTLTVILNGQTLMDKVEVEGLTAIAVDPHEDQPGPFILQGDHGPVEFRKITVTPLVKR
jgi:hypothetical protein